VAFGSADTRDKSRERKMEPLKGSVEELPVAVALIEEADADSQSRGSG
jgi:hypothetical protein